MGNIENGNDNDASGAYLDLLKEIHDSWSELEQTGDESVQLSSLVITAIQEAVRAEARHGKQVQMPPTTLGPYSVSELTVRNLIRSSVDSVEGALALHSSIITEDSGEGFFELGMPVRIICYISVQANCPNYRAIAEQVRSAVAESFVEQLGLRDVDIDIHIEDLHE